MSHGSGHAFPRTATKLSFRTQTLVGLATYPKTIKGRLHFTSDWVKDHLNFYRTHVLACIITPLLFSIVFYFSNGQYPISYVDSLFLCVTSITVCGLATVDLSSLTPFQQALLFIQMFIGSPIIVSLVVVQSRKWMFEAYLEPIVRRAAKMELDDEKPPIRERVAFKLGKLFSSKSNQITQVTQSASDSLFHDAEGARAVNSGGGARVHAGMIRRTSNAPQRVNPSGFVLEEAKQTTTAETPLHLSVLESQVSLSDSPRAQSQSLEHVPPIDGTSSIVVRSAPGDDQQPVSRPTGHPLLRHTTTSSRYTADQNQLSVRRVIRTGRAPSVDANEREEKRTTTELPRTATVEFAGFPQVQRWTGPIFERSTSVGMAAPVLSLTNRRELWSDRMPRRSSTIGEPNPPVTPSAPGNTWRSTTQGTQRDIGFGGFPGPVEILSSLFARFAPGLVDRVREQFSMPRNTTLISVGQVPDTRLRSVRTVNYTTGQFVVGRNSQFHGLTEEVLEELGGVEYRAIKILRPLIIAYYVGLQGLAMAILIPYMSTATQFFPVFENQWRYVSPAWFAAFQIVSAFTNTGTSLSDMSMIPFHTAYPMIFVMVFLILAGNTCYPVFLRWWIWLLRYCIPKNSSWQAPLQYLLDHPRRCYIYLFPKMQTWILFVVVLILTSIDWLCFLVLDIGDPIMESIPIGIRIAIGLLQACAVRAAGFATVAIAGLAPAVKVLYVIMMYISVYPIAMSVRNTNVYEEQSLGLFGQDDMDDAEHGAELDNNLTSGRHGRGALGQYLAYHARKQLAFDMWWLSGALILICIFERGPLSDPDNLSWYGIFPIIFEIVSGYGGVGLSLGLPYANYSTSGAWSPISKVILMAILIRGRHRGLPVAIDRAIVLPTELKEREQTMMAATADDNDIKSFDPLSNDNPDADDQPHT